MGIVCMLQVLMICCIQLACSQFTTYFWLLQKSAYSQIIEVIKLKLEH